MIRLHLKNVDIDYFVFAHKIEQILGSLNGVKIVKNTFIVEVDEEKYERLKSAQEFFKTKNKTMIITEETKTN